MQDARIRLALLIVCLACLIGSGFVLLAHRATPPPVTITPPPAEAPAAAPPITSLVKAPHAAPTPTNRLYVDVAGAVRRPSLYVLPPDSRVMQAILAAGGPTAEADMDAVNLAQKVTDGEKVLVPKRGLAPPQVAEDASPPAASASTSQAASKSAKGARAGHTAKIMAESGEQIPLNTAMAADLQRLPGVGPSMADRILAYRRQTGRFEKVEDLMQVTGIGPKKFAKIAPFVKLD